MICTVTFNPSLDYIVSVEDFKLGLTNRTSSELMLPGGKGINVSTVLMNLGIENTALGFMAGFVGDEIVDLERNDLNRVCTPGSVKVTELFTVEAYATVFHLVSDIEGKLEEGKNVMDLLKAAFPGGSITGAPKYRAMEIIDELEHGKRNLYTGSIGYLTLDGSCDFNIVIRTALHKNGKYHLGVGGGITAESDLEFEYEETLQKAKAILDALQ